MFFAGMQQRRRVNQLSTPDSTDFQTSQLSRKFQGNDNLEQEYENKLSQDPKSISTLSNYARYLFTTAKYVLILSIFESSRYPFLQ